MHGAWSALDTTFFVSILVFVELALGLLAGAIGCDPDQVSILVFVELALGHCIEVCAS